MVRVDPDERPIKDVNAIAKQRVGIIQRFVSYTGAGILAASIAALAIRFW